MWIHFSIRRFRGCQPSWYLLKTLYKYIYARRDRSKREYLVYAEACIIGKASLVFGQTVFWNQMGILYQTESFLTACISLVHEPDKPWSKQKLSCTNSRKELRRNCSPIGHNNTKHFLCPIRSRHLLEFLEMVRWESVPRGSSALT